MSSLKIGVLALQGAFAKHLEMLKSLNIDCVEVRTPQDLKKCEGLIIPGGESTTIFRQLWYIDLFNALIAFSKEKPVFGTCAGLILMSQEILKDKEMKPFGILDISVERNAFGRQVESFRTDVEVLIPGKKTVSYPAMFIRAPRIRSCGQSVKILASYEGEAILIQQGRHLGATFHPELSTDPLIHKFFYSLVSN